MSNRARYCDIGSGESREDLDDWEATNDLDDEEFEILDRYHPDRFDRRAINRALLHDVLPVDAHLHGETVREHVFATAERLEAELGPEQVHFDDLSQGEIEASADPGAPVTVGLDGAFRRWHPGFIGTEEAKLAA